MKEILTLQEVAEYLQLSDKTILKMVKSGEIPCAKIANQWRFSKVMLDDWITAKMEVIPQNDFSRLVEKEFDFIQISRLIDESSILPELKGTTGPQVITELAENAYKNELIANKEEFIKKLLEREQITSTSIGQGIALPHLRKPCGTIVTEPKIVIGKSTEGIDFSSMDGKKTYIFLLLLSDSEVVHLKILSKLSQILSINGNIDKLKKIKEPKEFIKFFIIGEQQINNKE
ncbi:PTS sugar transporter subunit IIA [Thiospirochaeta perfilievii]|nr:PTS sugar transporter subunit IIA [Thiospirochaeta perfilievii]